MRQVSQIPYSHSRVFLIRTSKYPTLHTKQLTQWHPKLITSGVNQHLSSQSLSFSDTSFQRLIWHNLVPPWTLCHEIDKTQGKNVRRSKIEVGNNALSFTHLLGTCHHMSRNGGIHE
jgi:hypothetical protein